jgi:hypothetical protein
MNFFHGDAAFLFVDLCCLWRLSLMDPESQSRVGFPPKNEFFQNDSQAYTKGTSKMVAGH